MVANVVRKTAAHAMVALTITFGATSTAAASTSSLVEATANHPIYSTTRATYVPASDLKPGEHLRTGDGTTATITSSKPYSIENEVFNLTIEGDHTYYITTKTDQAETGTDAGILTHNCGNSADAEQTKRLISAVEGFVPELKATVGGNSKHGPVLTGVLDRQSGAIYFGTNHVGRQTPVGAHPSLQARIDSNPIPADSWHGNVGFHSEFYALDQGLKARPGAQISDFSAYSIRLTGKRKGEQILKCPNCSAGLPDLEDVSP